MKNSVLRLIVMAMTLIFSGVFVRQASAVVLKPGDLAPDFTLPDQYDQLHHLASYRGHTVVLAFYPADFTLG